MEIRPATEADVPALHDLTARWDTAHFGAAEHSVAEIREFLSFAEPIAENTLLMLADGRLHAAGQRWGGEDCSLLVDPDLDGKPYYDVLLPWLAERPRLVEVLSSDAALLARVDGDGWTYHRSAYDLKRTVTPELVLDRPRWPDGVRVDAFDRADIGALHQLIYTAAAWAEVPGHTAREFDNWSGIFANEQVVPAQQVVVRSDERIVGVALTRLWDDGMGYVLQLAVARDQRGRGLGRALLLEALHRQLAAGATSLGLAVQATNATALRLYESVGLVVDREWQTWRAP